MTNTLNKLVYKLMTDTIIDVFTKKSTLEEWKEKLITANAGRLMDKALAHDHFECLAVIDNALKEVETLI